MLEPPTYYGYTNRRLIGVEVTHTLDIMQTVIDLAYSVRIAVRPYLGRSEAKDAAGKTDSGDVEFVIDEIAETAIESFIRKNALNIAYYSEGRGLVEFGSPEYILIIDPIDGTRPAMTGLEGGVVSIAAAPYSSDACMKDVSHGCILELKTDRIYTAERGGMVRIMEGERELPVRTTKITNLDNISWSYELAGRPMRLLTQVLAPLIDRSSIRGGVFVISSTAFSLTRMVSGQFDAVVDVANRILREYPEFRPEFVRAGLGTTFGLFPYDFAAALLIAETAGCKVTDAYGNSLGDTSLLSTSEENISSLVGASNPVLHEKLMEEIDGRMKNGFDYQRS